MARGLGLRVGFRVKALGGQVGGRFLISWDLGNGGSSGLISQTGSQHALLDPQASSSPPSPGLGHLPPRCEWLQWLQGKDSHLAVTLCLLGGRCQIPARQLPRLWRPPGERACGHRLTPLLELVLGAGKGQWQLHVLPCPGRDRLSPAGCTTALWARGSPPREWPAQASTGPSKGGARAGGGLLTTAGTPQGPAWATGSFSL